MTYWENHNPAYRSIPDNCTNVVSQALAAGGWSQVDGYYTQNNAWWYDAILPIQTYTWVNAEDLYQFGNVNANRFHRTDYLEPYLAGDIAFFQWYTEQSDRMDHAAVITWVDASGMPYFTENSNDHVNKSSAAMLAEHPINDVWSAYDI
ncbi:amidase domain-containing protein [Cryobacterium algoricola]|uniref:amidase domain-containing protein n=1 Tax=Cryobacterium algoricola TaxID=1259183 RepID=UPI00141AE87F|nr:amidase domain-containing protein [Cryobacterium algoricola]